MFNPSGPISIAIALFLLLLISLLSIVVPLCEADAHETLAKRSVSGRPFYFREIIPNTFQISEVYDTLYPIVFEYTTPHWSRPINLIGYTCTGDDYENDGWSCPVLWYWLTGIRDKLQEEIYVDNMKQPDNSSFRTIFNCNQFREVFEGLYLSAGERSRFLSFLQESSNCQASRTTIVGKSDKYVANGIDAPYRMMREKFFSEYYSLQTPVNRSNDATYTNARYNYYSSGLLEYYIESRRWTAGLEACKNGRLPSSLIPLSALEPLLRQVAQNASGEGFELAYGLDKISRYYKYDGMVDCAFTPDSILVVLQVPVRMSSSKDPQFLELIPVPYKNDQGEVCWIDESEGKFVALNGRVVPLADNFHCHKSGLCQIDAEVDVPLRKTSCTEALYAADDDSDACRVTCTKKTSNFPVTTRVTDDRVIVFGTEKDLAIKQVKIVCPSFQKMEPIETSGNAIEVTLPCGCEIHKAGKSVFMAKGKCGGEVHVIKI